MSTGYLYEVVQITGRFQRSVQLVRDWREQRGIEEYLLSPTAHSIANQILEGAFREHHRAWSLTGPYGTGKSAFALFLTDLLANKPPKHPKANALRQALNLDQQQLLPVLLIGQRESLKKDLLLALAEAVEGFEQDFAVDAKKASKRKSTTARDVADLYEQAGQLAQKHNHTGLLLIVDEFGKYLEHAAAESRDEDLFVMQEIGEAAARSPFPFLVITILHSAFADYLSIVDNTRRAEWQKIQGRYADIAFLEPPEQFLRLLGSAISFHEEHKPTQSTYERQITAALWRESFNEARQRIPIDELLPACAPLHPLTALILWPLFRSTLSQNERSLFAFLSDGSPFGFLQYLKTTPVQVGAADMYPLHALYDYLMASLGDALLVGLNARRWAEISNALARLSADAPPLSPAIIKVVGILSIFGRAMGLKATDETIRQAFIGDAENNVRTALDYLESASILVFRRFENAYGLWEGSDVDLEASYALARKQMRSGGLAGRLNKLITLRPFVARAHYVRTGTLRYFDVQVIDGTTEMLDRWRERSQDSADGQVVFVLSQSQKQRRELIALARQGANEETSISPLLIWAFPKPLAQLEQLIGEVECWRWVQANVPELQGDPVARAEVRAHVQRAMHLLQNAAGESLGLRGYAFKPQNSEWVCEGRISEFKSAIDFQRWLSGLCDAVYDEAPPLHNELLNREELSSAASAARRDLIEAMLMHEHNERLGIEGYPAEFSMYRSLLHAGKFHRKKNGHWRFGAPGLAWRPVWHAMKQFLHTSRKGRLPVTDLTKMLQQPPYGLRSGPIPVLFCALILAHRDTVALYEEGVLIPELRIEVLERLMRAPDRFELQWYQFGGQDRRILETIQRAIAELRLGNGGQDQLLLAIVKSMILFLARLPAYTKATKRLAPHVTVSVRAELVRAGDPYELVFGTLPRVLSINDVDEQAAEYARKLKACLLALKRAYPELLDQIETYIRKAFILDGTAQEARDQFVRRAAPLVGHSSDPALSLLVSELQRLDNRDWREVVGRIVTEGVPTDRWRDRDVVDFQVGIQHLAADFLRLEELIAERGLDKTSKIFRVGLLDGRLEEQRALVSIPAELAEQVDALAAEIGQMINGIDKAGTKGRRVQIAALAKAAARLIAAQEEEDSINE